jgi:hypothetical protein
MIWRDPVSVSWAIPGGQLCRSANHVQTAAEPKEARSRTRCQQQASTVEIALSTPRTDLLASRSRVAFISPDKKSRRIP